MKSEKETIIGTASVELIRENPDGSADYMFNFPPEAMAALTRLGIMTALQAGVDGAKRYEPDDEELVHASDTSSERVDETQEGEHEFECPRCGHCCREFVGLTVWNEELEAAFEAGQAAENEACARVIDIALLGSEKALADQLRKAIRARKKNT
jgi:hypothetical protein